MKYPIYRKYKRDSEWHKILSATQILSVYKVRGGWRVLLTMNENNVQLALNNLIATDSNVDEFEKAYGEAQWNLSKANAIV